MIFKKGDIVRNKMSGSIGTVDRINPPGMPGFIIIRYHDKRGIPTGDGYCHYPNQVEKVNSTGEKI